MDRPFIVGIIGGSGSGKTRFATQLKALFDDDVVELFSLDNYYRPLEQQPVDQFGDANFDTPDSFFRDKLLDDILALREGKDLRIPRYEFNVNRGGEQQFITVKAAPIVVVEGLFTFHFREIVPLVDMKLFVEAPIWLMMKRRIERDELERGYGDLKATMDRYERHVVPAYNQFVLPYKDECDLVVPNHQDFAQGLQVVASHLKSVI